MIVVPCELHILESFVVCAHECTEIGPVLKKIVELACLYYCPVAENLKMTDLSRELCMPRMMMMMMMDGSFLFTLISPHDHDPISC